MWISLPELAEGVLEMTDRLLQIATFTPDTNAHDTRELVIYETFDLMNPPIYNHIMCL